jgi:energy-coupling factor transporter ATP-binding protein EcfA2
MDEATASVDFATDEAIQSAIRSEFKSSTLLTIAHRLSSVIDYDRLLVLSDGKVAEFDTPIVSPHPSSRVTCSEGIADDRTSCEKMGHCLNPSVRRVGNIGNCIGRQRRKRVGLLHLITRLSLI